MLGSVKTIRDVDVDSNALTSSTSLKESRQKFLIETCSEKTMGTTEEQLVSFFLHTMFVYPVTNYLVSPRRSYARWKGAGYAILFLAVISIGHVVGF